MNLAHNPHGAQVLKVRNVGLPEWLYCGPWVLRLVKRLAVPILFLNLRTVAPYPNTDFYKTYLGNLFVVIRGLNQWMCCNGLSYAMSLGPTGLNKLH